jgi:hypothetical protein
MVVSGNGQDKELSFEEEPKIYYFFHARKQGKIARFCKYCAWSLLGWAVVIIVVAGLLKD